MKKIEATFSHGFRKQSDCLSASKNLSRSVGQWRKFAPKAKKLGCEFEALDTDGMTAEKVHELAEVSLARARMRGRTQG